MISVSNGRSEHHTTSHCTFILLDQIAGFDIVNPNEAVEAAARDLLPVRRLHRITSVSNTS